MKSQRAFTLTIVLKEIIMGLVFTLANIYFITKDILFDMNNMNKVLARTSTLKSSKNIAFTLAEVLIILGIIGIVSAITMPTLINNYQSKYFKVAYKKAYADANMAFRTMLANDDYTVPVNVSTTGTYFSANNGWGEVFKVFSTYFKVTKTCFNGGAGKCFTLNAECGYYPNNCPSNSYAFIDANGRQWYMYYNNEPVFLVDVNGFKPPNTLGVDRFKFQFPLLEYYNNNTSYSTKPLLNIPSDMLTSQRWCPSGKCYWRSWLIN